MLYTHISLHKQLIRTGISYKKSETEENSIFCLTLDFRFKFILRLVQLKNTYTFWGLLKLTDGN